MKRWIFLLLVLLTPPASAARRAKNVILFIGDAGGLPILSAAAAYKGAAQSLFIQRMPYLGLMDTSTASAWVSDSAAGMTAIVTGRKTHGGILSQSDSAVRAEKDGEPLKTILEYAEERGLATGVISDDKVTGATPAACYAHANDRGKTGEIFAQLLEPRFGDGVDLLIGSGAGVLEAAAKASSLDVEAGLRSRGYEFLKSPAELQPPVRRAIMLAESGDYDIETAVRRAIEILSRGKKGYFLMVEVDIHTDKLKHGLDRTLVLDGIVENTVRSVKNDTLVIFAADHSFDTRVRGGMKGQPLLAEATAKPNVRTGDGHTGEEVVVTAHGPGAERVKGFFPNTYLFQIMMAAYGWK